jgi:hypothetical protein
MFLTDLLSDSPRNLSSAGLSMADESNTVERTKSKRKEDKLSAPSKPMAVLTAQAGMLH